MKRKVEGIRERKRRETRHAIEIASMDLVEACGLEGATIDAISKRADISPRTFFNYFDSKEDALLGIHAIELSEATIEGYVHDSRGSSTSQAVVHMLVQLIGPRLADRELFRARRQLIKQHPHLLERQVSQMTHYSEQLKQATQRLAAQTQNYDICDEDAGIILAICGSCVQAVVRKWALQSRKISLDAIEKEAIQKLHGVVDRI